MEIRALNARFGDSMLVLWGRPKRALLIDGGVGKTYGESIQPALEELRSQGVKALEALVVTHLDRDHIGGIADVIRRRHQHQLGIRDVWFNGERHLPAGVPRPRSVAQAEALGALLLGQGLAWNAAFSGDAIRTPARGPLPRIDLPGGLTVTVLSPNLAQLKRLAALWPEALAETSDHQRLPRARGASPKRPPASEPIDLNSLVKERFSEDSSVANGSSLALLLEHKGRAALMAGDAYLEADALDVEDPDGCSAVEGFDTGMAEIDQVVVLDDNVSLVLTLQVQEFVRLNAAEVAQDAPGDPLHGPIDALAIDRQPIRAVGDDHDEPAAGLRNAHHFGRANVFQFAVGQHVENGDHLGIAVTSCAGNLRPGGGVVSQRNRLEHEVEASDLDEVPILGRWEGVCVGHGCPFRKAK